MTPKSNRVKKRKGPGVGLPCSHHSKCQGMKLTALSPHLWNNPSHVPFSWVPILPDVCFSKLSLYHPLSWKYLLTLHTRLSHCFIHSFINILFTSSSESLAALDMGDWAGNRTMGHLTELTLYSRRKKYIFNKHTHISNVRGSEVLGGKIESQVLQQRRLERRGLFHWDCSGKFPLKRCHWSWDLKKVRHKAGRYLRGNCSGQREQKLQRCWGKSIFWAWGL